MNFACYTYNHALCENKYLDQIDDADSIKAILKMLSQRLLKYAERTRKHDKYKKFREFANIIGFTIRDEFKNEDGTYIKSLIKRSMSRFFNSRTKNAYYYVAMLKRLKNEGFFDKEAEWN